LKEKILITGSGLLGKELIKGFPNSEVYTTYKDNIVNKERSFFLDITNKNELNKIILNIKPDVIIHTAAITDLDWCEVNEKEAFRVNTLATIDIKKLAEKINSRLIFISTDTVFDGKDGNYNEGMQRNPINIYSKTKLEAEDGIMSYDKALIIRGTFYGLKEGMRESFFSYLITKLNNNENIRVPKDKINNGLFVKIFSEIIEGMYDKNLTGIYHIGSSDYKNNFEFAKQLADRCSLNKDLIEGCSFGEIFENKNLTAKRPLDTTLDVGKISKEIKMPSLSDVINSFFDESFTNFKDGIR